MKKALLVGLLLSLFCGCHHPETNNNSQQTSNKVDPTAAVVESFILGDENITTVNYLKDLPADYNEDGMFNFILNYGGYDMMVRALKMPDGDWFVPYHWCEEQDSEPEETEGQVEYKDPFEGKPYPVVHNPHFSFVTRNYGGETINLYKESDGQEVACTIEYREISLDVIDVDTKTRRILVQSNPKDWCWGEVEEDWQEGYRHPFVELRGWIDEEWVCANTVTTCP